MQIWLILLLIPLTLAKKGFFPNQASVIDHDHVPFYKRLDFLYITVPAAAAALLLLCCILCCSLYARHGACHLFDFPKNLQTVGDDHFLTVEEYVELERRQRLGLPVDSLLALDEQRRGEAQAEALAADPFLALEDANRAEEAAEKEVEAEDADLADYIPPEEVDLGEDEQPVEGDVGEDEPAETSDIPGGKDTDKAPGEQPDSEQPLPEDTADAQQSTTENPPMSEETPAGLGIGLPLPFGGHGSAADDSPNAAKVAEQPPLDSVGDAVKAGDDIAEPPQNTPGPKRSLSVDHSQSGQPRLGEEPARNVASDPNLQRISGEKVAPSPVSTPGNTGADPNSRIANQYTSPVNEALAPGAGRYAGASGQPQLTGHGVPQGVNPDGLGYAYPNDPSAARWNPADQAGQQTQPGRWAGDPQAGMPAGYLGYLGALPQFANDGRRMTLLDVARNARGYPTTPDGRPLPPQFDPYLGHAEPRELQAGSPAMNPSRSPSVSGTDPRQVGMNQAGPRGYPSMPGADMPVSVRDRALQYEQSGRAYPGSEQLNGGPPRPGDQLSALPRAVEQGRIAQTLDRPDQIDPRFNARDLYGAQLVSPGYAQSQHRLEGQGQSLGVRGLERGALGPDHQLREADHSSWTRLPYDHNGQVPSAYDPRQSGQQQMASQLSPGRHGRMSERDTGQPLDMTQNGMRFSQQQSPLSARSLEAMAGRGRPVLTASGPLDHRLVTGPDGRTYMVPIAQSHPDLYHSQVPGQPLHVHPGSGLQSPNVPNLNYPGVGVDRSRMFEHPLLPQGLYGPDSAMDPTRTKGEVSEQRPRISPVSTNGPAGRHDIQGNGYKTTSREDPSRYSGHTDTVSRTPPTVPSKGRFGSISRMSHSLRQMVESVKGQKGRSRSEEPTADATVRPRGSAAWLMNRVRSMRGVSEQPDQKRAQELRRQERYEKTSHRKRHGSSPQSKERHQESKRQPKDLEDGEVPNSPLAIQEQDEQDQYAGAHDQAGTQRRPGTTRKLVKSIKEEAPSRGQAPDVSAMEDEDPVQYVLEEHNGKKRIVSVKPQDISLSRNASSEDDIDRKSVPRAGSKRRKVKPRLTARSDDSLGGVSKKKRSKLKKKKKKHSRKSLKASDSDSESSSSSSSESCLKRSKKHWSNSSEESIQHDVDEHIYSERSPLPSDDEEEMLEAEGEDYRDRSVSRGSSISGAHGRSDSAPRESRGNGYRYYRGGWQRHPNQRYHHQPPDGYPRHYYHHSNHRGGGRPGYHRPPRGNGFYRPEGSGRRPSPIRGPEEPPPWTQTDLNRHGQPRRRPVVFQNESLRAFVSLPPRPRPERGMRGRPCDRGGGPPYRGRGPRPFQTNQSFMHRPRYSESPMKGGYPCRPIGPRTPPLPGPGSPSTTPPRPAPRADPRLCASASNSERERARESQIRRIVYGQASKEDLGCVTKLKQIFDES